MPTDKTLTLANPLPGRGMPTILKVILTTPLIMALLGAEIELSLAPQLDVILTAAGAWALWAWLSGWRSS
jgi:hypothetical protein